MRNRRRVIESHRDQVAYLLDESSEESSALVKHPLNIAVSKS
jgi:hypothetical protein